MSNHSSPHGDKQALLAIQKLLSGNEWSPDTLEYIATILAEAGYEIADLNTMQLRDADIDGE
jgi:hypothetical protein